MPLFESQAAREYEWRIMDGETMPYERDWVEHVVGHGIAPLTRGAEPLKPGQGPLEASIAPTRRIVKQVLREVGSPWPPRLVRTAVRRTLSAYLQRAANTASWKPDHRERIARDFALQVEAKLERNVAA